MGLDFVRIIATTPKKGIVEISPKFIVGKSKDLMIRGGDFYAIFNPDTNFWSTDEDTVIYIIDSMLDEYYEKHKDDYGGEFVNIKYMWDSDSGSIDRFHKYCQKQSRDFYHELDESLIFKNQQVKHDDYASKTLPYSLDKGSTEAWDEITNTLYEPDEKFKIEWTIGAILTGDSKHIQKMVVFYGDPGTGKSTIMNIMQMLFDGYWKPFDPKSIGSSTSEFALEQLKSNPLVAICHDTDLSHMDSNERLNSLISHEKMTVNEKHKALYSMIFKTFPIAGTNKPVYITDAKSGMIRRVIDISPSNRLLSRERYNILMDKVRWELSGIASKCIDVYEGNVSAFNDYVAEIMLEETNDIFNFVQDNITAFDGQDAVPLSVIWDLYKAYVEEAGIKNLAPRKILKREMKSYFNDYKEDYYKDGKHYRSAYIGLKIEKFQQPTIKRGEVKKFLTNIELKEQPSLLDEYCADSLAQYGTVNETPQKPWAEVTTTLKDIDTKKLHYLKPSNPNLIFIDFDLKDKDGNKCLEKNLSEASKWPATYTETSKGGQGLHLYYIYDGDPNELSYEYSPNIEIKVCKGGSSIRRRVTICNDSPIAHISDGLPLREVKQKMSFDFSTDNLSESLRTIAKKAINKEYHSATVCNVSFVYDMLEDAYKSGYAYDISDMYFPLQIFCINSTHQANKCLGMLQKMHLRSDANFVPMSDKNVEEKPIVFFDWEVFPNVNFVNWKILGDKTIHRAINPTPKYVIELIQGYRLVGYNCRRYDNHIMHAVKLGWTPAQVYLLSQKLVADKGKDCYFGPAWNYSYTDIYDYCTKKQSLKKWEIELGLRHMELGLPWDKPVPEELWPKVSEYCDNDVVSTEAVWNATQADFEARKMLVELAGHGMTVNNTTNNLTAMIIYDGNKNPTNVYTHLEETFPGYEFYKQWNPNTGLYEKKNLYRGIDLGFGGYVYAEPGTYYDVALLDVESMHPHSAIALNYFGDYTKRFEDLVESRCDIKHKDFESAKKRFDGKLAPYLEDGGKAKKLSKALKIPINSVYGLTSAKFANEFTCQENDNNIVALRGALFMKTLQDEVVKKGFQVAHIKTDSIKIPGATKEIIDFCMNFAHMYGYKFEHEATYKKICLVNDAVYIAKFMQADECIQRYGYSPEENSEEGGKWTATGTQFAIPYVFKKLFSHEDIKFEDLCETKEVKSAMHLKFDEEHIRFIGRVGLFSPMTSEANPGELVRENMDKEGNVKYDAVVGTKGYKWLESYEVQEKHLEHLIDYSYYDKLVNDAIKTLEANGADMTSFTE